MALASSVTLKALDEAGMARLNEGGGIQRHNSLSSITSTTMMVSSMLFYSQSNARWVLASTVMTPAGPSILSLS
jgi:hypothetical protein